MTQRTKTIDISPRDFIRKVLIYIIAIYILITVGFYFLAGEQLRLRDSRSNIVMQNADMGTVELADDAIVEQAFYTDIQRIQSISVQWGTYYRNNRGTANIQLLSDNSVLLAEQSIDMSTITEGGLSTLVLDEPLEGLAGTELLLRLSSPDASKGSSISPFMSRQTNLVKGKLYINGVATPGVLCFSVTGQDYIWTGLHYWQFMFAGLLFLAAFLFWEYNNYIHNKRCYLINAILALKQYKFLIDQLVSRDFKTKYKRSVLGMFWSFLNPLLMMSVQYFVFSTLFKTDIPYYPAYLLSGIVAFNFFSESTSLALSSILGNASLITKVYMPKYIYPLVRVLSSTINLGISLIPMLMVCIITGVRLKKSAVLALFFFICLALFCIGLGMFLSTLMVFFRDIQFLWSVMTIMWMYATPIFYPESILPENMRIILEINPLYHMIKGIRTCLISGISPEPLIYFKCIMFAIVMVIVGAIVFKKNQDKFILYL